MKAEELIEQVKNGVDVDLLLEAEIIGKLSDYQDEIIPILKSKGKCVPYRIKGDQLEDDRQKFHVLYNKGELQLPGRVYDLTIETPKYWAGSPDMINLEIEYFDGTADWINTHKKQFSDYKSLIAYLKSLPKFKNGAKLAKFIGAKIRGDMSGKTIKTNWGPWYPLHVTLRDVKKEPFYDFLLKECEALKVSPKGMTSSSNSYWSSNSNSRSSEELIKYLKATGKKVRTWRGKAESSSYQSTLYDLDGKYYVATVVQNYQYAYDKKLLNISTKKGQAIRAFKKSIK